MPSPCVEYFSEIEDSGIIIKKSMYGIYVTAFLLMIIITLFLFVCYKRVLKTQLNKDMQIQLNATVSQYFALNDAGDPTEKDTKRLVDARDP